MSISGQNHQFFATLILMEVVQTLWKQFKIYANRSKLLKNWPELHENWSKLLNHWPTLLKVGPN
jgi:hypothetical protein